MNSLLSSQMLLLAFITFLPVLVWFFLWRFHDSEKEPIKAMLISFLLGALTTLPFFLVGGSSHSFGDLFFFAFVEEVLKALALVLAIEFCHRWFTQIVDGLIYGAVIGLGFAFVENLFYFMPFFESGFETISAEFYVVYAVRSLHTMVAHTMFTALFGFFYASAYLRKEIFPEKKKEKPWHHFFKNIGEALPLHVTLFHLLPNRPSKHGHYPGSLILEGILVAGFLHGIFNLFFQVEVNGLQFGFLNFLLVCLIVYGVWRMFFQSVYVRIVRRVKG